MDGVVLVLSPQLKPIHLGDLEVSFQSAAASKLFWANRPTCRSFKHPPGYAILRLTPKRNALSSIGSTCSWGASRMARRYARIYTTACWHSQLECRPI